MTIYHSELGNSDVHPIGHVDTTLPTGTISVGTAFVDTDTDRLYLYGAAIAWPGAPTADGNWHVILDERDYDELAGALTTHETDEAGHDTAEPETLEDADGIAGFISAAYLNALLAVGAGGYALGGTDFPEVTADDGTFTATINGNSFSSQIRLATSTYHGFMSKDDKAFVDDHIDDEEAAHPLLVARVEDLEDIDSSAIEIIARKALCCAGRGFRTYYTASDVTTRAGFISAGANVRWYSYRSTNAADCYGDWIILSGQADYSYLQTATFSIDVTVWNTGDGYPQTLDIYVPLGSGTGTIALEVWDMSNSGASVTVNLTEDVTADPIVWHAPAVASKEDPDTDDAFKFSVTVGNEYRIALSWSVGDSIAGMTVKPWTATDGSTTYQFMDQPLSQAFILTPRSITE